MPLEEKTKRKKIIKSFVHRILPQLIFFLLNGGLIGVILFLTYQEFLYYGYIMQLITFFFLLSLVYQYFQYRKSIRIAEREEEQSDLEKDYLVQVYEEKQQHILEEYYAYKQMEVDKQLEQMDYFSLWFHQIKTPLSAMSVLLQKMDEEIPEKKTLEEELIRLNDYTHLALNYLKLEDAGKELEVESFSLDDVLTQALKKYAIFFIYHPIQLDYTMCWGLKKGILLV